MNNISQWGVEGANMTKLQTSTSSEILFVDSHVEDADILLADLPHSMTVVHLPADQDPLAAMQDALQDGQTYSKMHILSHGAPGSLALSEIRVDSAYLEAHAATLKTIFSKCSEIALWACDVAKDTVGQAFTQTLELLSGAHVFAASQPVGASAQGGTWNIGTAVPFSARSRADYPHTLASTFDGDGGNAVGTDYTEADNGDGISMTVTFNGDSANIAPASGGGGGGTTGNTFFGLATTSVTVTFNNPVDIISFIHADALGNAPLGTLTYDVTVGNGTPFDLTGVDFTYTNNLYSKIITPADWTDVTSFTITTTEADMPIVLDTLVYNIRPTSAGAPTDVTVSEDIASNIDLSSMSFTETEGEAITVTLSVDAGTFSTPADGTGDGVTATLVNATTVTLTGSAANVTTYLNTASNIQYTGASNVNGDNAATLTVTPNDGTADGAASTINIDITAIDDAPTLTATGDDPSFTEGAGAAGLFSAASVSTVEAGQTLTDFVMTVTNVSDGADEVLNADGSSFSLTNGTAGTTATNSLSYSVSVTGSTATITFTGGTMSEAAFTTLVNGMTYQNNSEAPTEAGDRVFTITSLTDDGISGGNNQNTASLSVSSTVSVAGSNDDPVVTAPSAPTVAEDDTDVAIANDIDISDLDGDAQTITLTITGGTVSIGTSGLAFSTGDGTDDANMTFSGSLTDINTALDAMTFTPTADLNGVNAGGIQIQANDGNGGTHSDIVQFNISSVNDLPVLTGLPASQSLDTGVSNNIDMSASNLTDVDIAGAVTVRLTVDAGTFGAPADGAGVGGGVTETLVNATTITLVGDMADINTYLDTASNITYTPPAGSGTVATLTFEADDGFGFTSVGSMAFDVAVPPSNDPGDQPTSTLPTEGTTPTEGDDVLQFGRENNRIVLGDGDDFVNGGAGNDKIWAGPTDTGNDTIEGGKGNDTMGGGAGDDLLVGGAGSDRLLGGSGNDQLFTSFDNPGDENGDTSPNIAWAGTGNDTVTGGFGDDKIGGGLGSDVLYGGAGDDLIFGGASDEGDTISAGSGADEVFSGDGDDVVNGDDGNDTLFSGAGNDTVNGGAGNDLLWGGAGDDQFTGGDGADRFRFNANSGNDIVTDFNIGQDDLILGGAFTNLTAVKAASSTTTVGGDSGLLIDLGTDTSVFLKGLTVGDLDSMDITF